MSIEKLDEIDARHKRWRADHLPSDEAMALARDVQQLAAALFARGMTLRQIQLDRIPVPPPAAKAVPGQAWVIATVAGEVRVEAPLEPTRGWHCQKCGRIFPGTASDVAKAGCLFCGGE